MTPISIAPEQLLQALRELIQQGRQRALRAVAFPIRDALRRELSWTHYRNLLRVENEAAAQNWSARALDRRCK